jgi:hypothetical protein
MIQNQYTQHEQASGLLIYHDARLLARQYAGQQDHKAATVALLVEALILAGGQSFLKPTEE